MPILIISALILAGLGYWQYTRPKGPLTPQQVVSAEAPSLSKEIMDLYANGRNPQAMHRAAEELEKYGFFDSAALLRKRADDLTSIAALATQTETTRIETERARVLAEQEAERIRQETASRQAAMKAVEDEERAAEARFKAAQDAAVAAQNAAAAEQRRQEGLLGRVPAPAPGTIGTVTIQRQPLQVRNEPNFTSPPIAETIPTGGSVVILDSTNLFYKVRYQPPGLTPFFEGWVDRNYIALSGGSLAPSRLGRGVLG